MPNELNNK